MQPQFVNTVLISLLKDCYYCFLKCKEKKKNDIDIKKNIY